MQIYTLSEICNRSSVASDKKEREREKSSKIKFYTNKTATNGNQDDNNDDSSPRQQRKLTPCCKVKVKSNKQGVFAYV